MTVQYTVDELRLRLATCQITFENSAEYWLLRCCELAFTALERGDYGVGAVLLDAQGQCLAEAGNRVFSDYYNSAAHAEMLVLDQFEKHYPNDRSRDKLHLITSLEPCPMCSTRILAAGVGKVTILACDPEGGALLHCDKLPPAWRNLAQLPIIHLLDGENPLAKLAADIAFAQANLRRQKLIHSIRP